MLWVRISIRARYTTLCDKVCQRLATGRRFSLSPPVSSTNSTDRHDIAEILLKVVFNTIKQTSIICHVLLYIKLYCSSMSKNRTTKYMLVIIINRNDKLVSSTEKAWLCTVYSIDWALPNFSFPFIAPIPWRQAKEKSAADKGAMRRRGWRYQRGNQNP